MSNKSKLREESKKLNPIDDIMFRKMAEELAISEEILQVIMNTNAQSSFTYKKACQSDLLMKPTVYSA